MEARLRREISARYHDALLSYLTDQHETHLLNCYEIGRFALSSSMGILDVLNMHNEVMNALVRENTPADPGKFSELGMSFLLECLSPFEMMHKGDREANAALRRLNDLLEAQARRIAHDLHDEFAQMLATVYLSLAEISRQPVSELILSIVSRITTQLDLVREQMRRLSHELRPPMLDQLGLMPALEFLANGFRKRTGLNISVSGSTDGRLDDTVEITIYRIVQEALNNISRHAQAHRVRIKLARDEGMVQCTVQDDGIGFSTPGVGVRKPPKGLGLIGIQERLRPLHGTLSIDSRPGKGTEIKIVVPIESSKLREACDQIPV
jgi:signal transduction histidine kinase